MLKTLKQQLYPRQSFKYNIEKFSEYNGVVFISGWAYFENALVNKISYSTKQGRWRTVPFEFEPSPDVAKVHKNEIARNVRFSIRLFDDLPDDALSLRLLFHKGSLLSAQQAECALLHKDGINRGPYNRFVPNFFRDYVNDKGVKSALEIGSRARSGVNNRDTYLAKEIEFTGIDVLAGEGVDVVCDAHQLSDHIEHNKYDLVYSLNVFEHLLMPWKVVIEINKVMKEGGIVMIFTHHAFPLHDLPWDFFRFSDNAWYSMFNRATGFEILETQLIDPVSIVPDCIYEGSVGVKDEPAFIHSAVIARKISETTLEWPVDSRKVLETEYPE